MDMLPAPASVPIVHITPSSIGIVIVSESILCSLSKVSRTAMVPVMLIIL